MCVCVLCTHICQALGSVLSGNMSALAGGLSSLGDVPRMSTGVDDSESDSDDEKGNKDKKGSKDKKGNKEKKDKKEKTVKKDKNAVVEASLCYVGALCSLLFCRM